MGKKKILAFLLSGVLLLQSGVYAMAEPGDALTQESTESSNAIESTVSASDERDEQETAENEVSEESGTEKTDTEAQISPADSSTQPDTERQEEVPEKTSEETSETIADVSGQDQIPDNLVLGGYIESDLDHNTSVYHGNSTRRRTGGKIPASYQSDISQLNELYPAVRDQNPYGNCWAFATIGAAEFDLINKGQLSQSADLSELQLSYFTFNFVQDPLGGTAGDVARYYNENTDTNYLNYGGNYQMAVRRLGQWIGVTNESSVPYTKAAQTVSSGVDEQYAYSENAAHLENAYLINIHQNTEDVKRQIMEHGAVGVMYTHYYNGATHGMDYNAYYDTANTTGGGGGHAVMIVGWDDTFSKDNFLRGEKPSEDGAWLVRNSWGSYFDYFWMSYETHSLADTAWVFDLTTDDGYDHNYQIDGGLETYASGSGTTVANVFTVPEKENGVSETLKAVSLSLTHAAGVIYTIDIYTDIRNKYNPTSGTKHESASTSGSTTYAGVYTIPLNDDVELKPGTTFSVVVTLDRAVMDCEQATAIQKEEDFGTDKYVWMRQVSMYNYKSFYQSGSGFTPNIQNYCIKAYTSDGTKTEENSENLQGYTLTLDGSIGVNFYMGLSNEFVADDAYMEFSLPNGDTQQIKVSEAKKKDDSYVFTCKVAAKEMTTDIQAQMVAGDVRGEMYTYNVKQYADYILAHTDAYSGSAVALVKSMLNYGAAAQQLFSYRTDTLANADLNEEDKVIDSVDFSNYQYTVTQKDQVTGIQYYGSVLSLKSEICMKNYFLIDAGKSVDDYVFSIESETGGKVILEPQEARINGKTCYYVTVKDIKAYDMDQNMTITVCENNQNETGLELHYGIFSYADAVSKLQNPDQKLVTVTKALYQYWEDVKQYQAEVNG